MPVLPAVCPCGLPLGFAQAAHHHQSPSPVLAAPACTYWAASWSPLPCCVFAVLDWPKKPSLTPPPRCRVGHLLSAYHHLAALCRHTGLAFACATDPHTGGPCLLPTHRSSSSTAPSAAQQEGLEAGSSDFTAAQQQQQPAAAPHSEPAIFAVLALHAPAIEALVEHAKQGGALQGWHFLLEYPTVGAVLAGWLGWGGGRWEVGGAWPCLNLTVRLAAQECMTQT